MAIKTVSQLEAFQNDQGGQDGSSNHGKVGVGQNLAFFEDGYLTTADKGSAPAVGGSSNEITAGNAYSTGIISAKFNTLKVADGSTYWSSLFEISQPERKSQVNAPENEPEFRSYSIQYEDILKNILWDVKSYLNFRNHLNDYDLCSIVEGDQYFQGKKYVVGGLSVSEALSSNDLTATNLTATNLTATNSILTRLLKTNDLSVHEHLTVDCNISTSNDNTGFDGWAFGLMDRGSSAYNTTGKLNINRKTTVGTYETLASGKPANYKDIGKDENGNTLYGKPNRSGDPIIFKDGRPYELTAVNFAHWAYNLVNPNNGNSYTVGKARYITNGGQYGGKTWNGFTPTDTVIKMVSGVPTECNVIDFANHALWSDLGEKYSADCFYEPGTLVKFGGEKEITIADDEVNAIVSTKAFSLNTLLKDGITIALCGRVPTKVKGKIKKFEKIMLSDTPGIACVWDGKSRVIGRALESNDNEEVKLVECVTKFEL